MLKILILLPYFNRPKLVRNALKSLQDQSYTNWELACLDDMSDSDKLLSTVVEEFFPNDTRIHHYYVTKELKEKHNNITSGILLNKALDEIEHDLCIILCDDDALVPHYLRQLNVFFTNRPEVNYSYSKVIPFNPLTEEFNYQIPIRPYETNVNRGPIHPSNRVDASQVCWRKNNARFTLNRFADLDKDMWDKLYELYGPCIETMFYGEYKGVHNKQLINFRTDVEAIYKVFGERE
jgi:glycosyltransferase involved in cell wall biosynthesis